jgi:TonB family protein
VKDSTDLTRAEAQAIHAQSEPHLPGEMGLDSPPRILHSRFPDYPQKLRNADVTGVVVVRFFIEPDGTVSQPVVAGTPPAALAALSLDAIREWRFEPARKNGVPVRVRVQQSFDFRVE